MFQVLAVAGGVILGFGASRAVHKRNRRAGSPRPASAAPAASQTGVARPASADLRLASDKGATAPRSPTPPSGRASLARADSDKHERYDLDRPMLTIGRGADQDITLADTQVSRHHGTFRQAPSGWTYTDDGSSNGTRINDHTVPAGRTAGLRHGDRIEIGRAVLVFRQLNA